MTGKHTLLCLHLQVLKAKTTENEGSRNAVLGVRPKTAAGVLQYWCQGENPYPACNSDHIVNVLMYTYASVDTLTSVVCSFLLTDQRMRQAFWLAGNLSTLNESVLEWLPDMSNMPSVWALWWRPASLHTPSGIWLLTRSDYITRCVCVCLSLCVA